MKTLIKRKFKFRGLTFRELDPWGLEVRWQGKWYAVIGLKFDESYFAGLKSVDLWGNVRHLKGNRCVVGQAVFPEMKQDKNL